ncbi:MAG: DUF3048 domain-containing protein [Candidatus Promineifilaceae bacterium]|nr:DUF3048 domain-containing protein [Candidatus Promineifilaceae bacterium]
MKLSIATNLYLSILICLLVACTQPAETRAPTIALPTSTPEAVARDTAVHNPTQNPTNTPLPATRAPTALPTSTPTSTPTPMPTAVTLLAAADFGPNRNPLTGELVADTAVLQRRPLAVKVANWPPEHTRPQSGLGAADLVFEHPTEGAITRFTAIIYSRTPAKIGPIRSARLIDVEIPAMYDAGLAYSGASIGVSRRLGGSDIRPRLLRSYDPGYYRSGEDKPWEHTLYGDPLGFWLALEEKEQNVPPAFSSLMAFAEVPPANGQPAREIHVAYKDWTAVTWRYHEDSGRYLRWTDNEPHIDANTDEQLSAANVVVIFAIHQLDRSICEYLRDDECRVFSTEIQIWNEGPALIFRDGQMVEGTWRRENRSDMFTFYDEAGSVIPLQIGNTWFQVVPRHYIDPITVMP